MNKKGFTLVELLAVIAIVAIISLIAVPNIINIVDNIKKNNMIDDAKKLISLARYNVNASYEIRKSGSHTFTFAELNTSKEISSDPDGGEYSSASKVIYKITDDVATYCIYLDGSKRRRGTSSACVMESDLYSRDVVKTK